MDIQLPEGLMDIQLSEGLMDIQLSEGLMDVQLPPAYHCSHLQDLNFQLHLMVLHLRTGTTIGHCLLLCMAHAVHSMYVRMYGSTDAL